MKTVKDIHTSADIQQHWISTKSYLCVTDDFIEN